MCSCVCSLVCPSFDFPLFQPSIVGQHDKVHGSGGCSASQYNLVRNRTSPLFFCQLHHLTREGMGLSSLRCCAGVRTRCGSSCGNSRGDPRMQLRVHALSHSSTARISTRFGEHCRGEESGLQARAKSMKSSSGPSAHKPFPAEHCWACSSTFPEVCFCIVHGRKHGRKWRLCIWTRTFAQHGQWAQQYWGVRGTRTAGCSYMRFQSRPCTHARVGGSLHDMFVVPQSLVTLATSRSGVVEHAGWITTTCLSKHQNAG